MSIEKVKVFRGVGTALVTPFKNGKIDFEATARLIEWQIECGVSALVIGGTTGEAATLTDKERYGLYAFAAQWIDGRCKLILGTGTNDTRLALQHTRQAKDIGCDGALLVTPYYNKGTEEGIFRHYSTIAESVDIPIILYNVPSRTGVNLGLGLLERLSEIENIVGIKEAGDSVDRLVALGSLSNALPLYSGNDSQIYPTLSLGGEGVISVASNLYPKTMCKLCNAYFNGDLETGRRLQFEIMPFVRAIFAETNPSPIKYAMAARSLISDEIRLPLSTPREGTREMIDQATSIMDRIECEL